MNLGKAEAAELGGQRLLGGGLSVHQDDLAEVPALPRLLGEGQQVALIGVRAESVQDHHLGAAVVLEAEDPDPGPALDQPAPQGVLGLEADDGDGVLRESSRTAAREVRTRCLEPVTAWAAPRNWTSIIVSVSAARLVPAGP
jgi:hypothetical protein